MLDLSYEETEVDDDLFIKRDSGKEENNVMQETFRR